MKQVFSVPSPCLVTVIQIQLLLTIPNPVEEEKVSILKLLFEIQPYLYSMICMPLCPQMTKIAAQLSKAYFLVNDASNWHSD